MTELKQVYKCLVCGNIVEIVHSGVGTLICCNKPMMHRNENTEDGAKEKHVPVVEKIEEGLKVKIGEVEHPMLEEHYIDWIEVNTENKTYRKYLKPGEKPEAKFKIEDEIISVREYCNLHGLWKK
ncbi:desulfoferrodoxin [Clostridium rectalis]|uniref:desulfoferrodoxin n=1 Tax=Clostridium rectalis TaxID=2040295 RepID=UPI000F62FAC5|nr:desulfoferrodoxin [Clostridium rectalis]